jgi:ABC-type multidrug transport system fused ATPase/permease subunit
VSIVNQNICNRWINIVTDLFSVTTIAATGLFGVLSVAADLGKTSNNMVGLALVWSLQINGIMSFTLRLLADTESNMNSVIRLYEYIDNNPAEKSFEERAPATENWPTEGNYSINNASYRYRAELPLVLKKISFDIRSKEKIGVVGRTGSGKSTLTLGLLRILEMTANEDGSQGQVVLDGEDVAELGLHHLRQNVTIIPQDPTLFTGTLKSNIDPFNRYSDLEIAESLQKVSMWDQIREEPSETSDIRKKVYSKVDDSGSNFSLGQKQLICMARALIVNLPPLSASPKCCSWTRPPPASTRRPTNSSST